MTIYSAVLIQYQCVTDRQTNRQTDVQPISITCFSIADARKNQPDIFVKHLVKLRGLKRPGTDKTHLAKWKREGREGHGEGRGLE